MRLPWRLVIPATAGREARRTSEVQLAVGRRHGEPKLRRGTYVLSVSDLSGRGVPDWGQYEMGPDVEQDPVLVRHGVLGPEPPALEALILSLDHV